MIDKATIDRIMSSADIVDVVSEFVSLRKSGSNYKGLCPFHNEKTPSFVVSPSRGICHCFSCGKGGNAVNFIMEHEQMTYPEALRWLAKRYHIEIVEHEQSDEEKRRYNERESLFIVNEWAMGYFKNLLHNDVDGRAIGMQYFRTRGFRDDIIEKFDLGFALPGRTAFANSALAAGYKEDFLCKTGLCFKTDRGELMDKFSGRVIFPWINVSGKVCAFGGRLIDSRTKGLNQKYLNSPDSDIYHKDHELYGIYQAKKAIVKEDMVYMVEGYTDVISMHQCGIENVVANSGTALSIHQIRLLRRFTPNIILIYDGDEAGIHAALRGTDMLLAEGMNIKVLLLPQDEDPDGFAQKHSAEEFRDYIKANATDFIEFKTRVMLQGITDPIKKAEAVNSIIRSVSVIADPIIRASYLKECSSRLGIRETTLLTTMNKYIHSDKENIRKEEERQKEKIVTHIREKDSEISTAGLKIERMIAQMIVRYGNVVIYDEVEYEDETGTHTMPLTLAQYVDYDLGSDDLKFQNPIYERILEEAVAHSGEKDFVAETYFTLHPDIEISKPATELSIEKFKLSKSLQPNVTVDDIRNDILHLIMDYRMDLIENKIKEYRNEIMTSQNDPEKLKEAMLKYNDAQLIRNNLAKKLGSNIL